MQWCIAACGDGTRVEWRALTAMSHVAPSPADERAASFLSTPGPSTAPLLVKQSNAAQITEPRRHYPGWRIPPVTPRLYGSDIPGVSVLRDQVRSSRSPRRGRFHFKKRVTVDSDGPWSRGRPWDADVVNAPPLLLARVQMERKSWRVV
ncbi:hypothetical protein P4O66_002453 [Electrophorus voltai]|uniref:Uncharacterized protein n=1 Tax=Electrophorus voltai TaxID=2609070 RepID=A0AAD8YX38_9TELE|nr:hypothetical protein P4O66_002453 [Electrophorus voltai]